MDAPCGWELSIAGPHRDAMLSHLTRQTSDAPKYHRRQMSDVVRAACDKHGLQRQASDSPKQRGITCSARATGGTPNTVGHAEADKHTPPHVLGGCVPSPRGARTRVAEARWSTQELVA